MTREAGIRAGHGSLFTVAVHAAEEGGYWGEVLELPGCMSQGETEEELRRNIIDAIEAVLATYEEDGEEPPIQDEVVKLLQVRVSGDR